MNIQWNLLISNIALLATNLQVPGEDFVLIRSLISNFAFSKHFMSKTRVANKRIPLYYTQYIPITNIYYR